MKKSVTFNMFKYVNPGLLTEVLSKLIYPVAVALLPKGGIQFAPPILYVALR